MSTSRAGGRLKLRPPKPTPPPRPLTTREQWDQACARFVDAVMTDQPDTAAVALAEAFVLLGRLDLEP